MDEYVFQEFPKWKYHATGAAVVVQDADAEAALGDGWADAPVDPAAPAVEASDDAVTVESLRAQLDAKGIAYDKRWGIARLQSALEG